MTVANTSTPTLQAAMSNGDLATKLETGLTTTSAAANAVDAGGLAANLNNASSAAGNSVVAYK